MADDLLGKGPYVKIDGQATDAGMFEHVFDGTDDAYDDVIKMKRVQKILRKEMKNRGILKESFNDTLKSLTENITKRM